MAYGGGYEYGYADGSTGWTFAPTVAGADEPRIDERQPYGDRDPLWRFYSQPVQIHILYNSGVPTTRQRPTTDMITAADTGTGKGQRMVWPSPGTYSISEAEAVTIIADGTYGDSVGGGLG